MLCEGVGMPEQCRVDHAMVERQTLAVQQLLLSVAAIDATDPTVCACAALYSCSIQRNKGRIHQCVKILSQNENELEAPSSVTNKWTEPPVHFHSN
jgi:hypothetical protein